jgi:hypothetical protein
MKASKSALVKCNKYNNVNELNYEVILHTTQAYESVNESKRDGEVTSIWDLALKQSFGASICGILRGGVWSRSRRIVRIRAERMNGKQRIPAGCEMGES